jgi:hypothetical protein
MLSGFLPGVIRCSLNDRLRLRALHMLALLERAPHGLKSVIGLARAPAARANKPQAAPPPTLAQWEH